MDFSRDYADMVRHSRFEGWSKRGGPSRTSTWVIDHPRRFAWSFFVAEMAGYALIVTILGDGSLVDRLIEGAITAVAAAFFAWGMWEFAVGEAIVYEEWVDQRDSDRES